jgi:hypothetical protein
VPHPSLPGTATGRVTMSLTVDGQVITGTWGTHRPGRLLQVEKIGWTHP